MAELHKVTNGVFIEVDETPVDRMYTVLNMYDDNGFELILYDDQISLPIRSTKLAKKIYPDYIEEDGWMWIKK